MKLLMIVMTPMRMKLMIMMIMIMMMMMMMMMMMIKKSRKMAIASAVRLTDTFVTSGATEKKKSLKKMVLHHINNLAAANSKLTQGHFPRNWRVFVKSG